jgi:thiamine biosynthesis lipoprotein
MQFDCRTGCSWIAERAVDLLRQYGEACAVSAGGDIALSGLPRDQDSWQISLEDPQNIHNTLAVLNVQPGGLATSSVMKRRWLQGEQARHHIIDPRTGIPAAPHWLSVSVWMEIATYAEGFAKALLIASPQEAAVLAARIPSMRFIAVETDGSLWGLPESKEMISHDFDRVQ